jgi:uncharacterized protein
MSKVAAQAPQPGVKPVVVDTNALLLPFTEGTDVMGELERLVGRVELVVPSSILGELRRLAENRGEAGNAARSALRLAQRFRQEPTGLAGDDGLLDVARRLKAVVLTNDRKVQQEAATSGLQVVVAREKGRLAMRGSGSS